MGTKEKLIDRLKSKPKDFTFEELYTLLRLLGYRLDNAGKTSGSTIRFVRGSRPIRFHKPHPRNILKRYVIEYVIEELEKEGLL